MENSVGLIMYCLYLLGLFLLLEVDGKQPVHQGKRQNDPISFQETLHNQGNSSTITANLVMSPNQSRELETALNNVLSKLLGPQKVKLSLRATQDENTGLIYTLRVIGDTILREIKKLFGRLGLIRTTKPESLDNTDPNDLGLKYAVYHQLLRVPLALSPIWREVKKQMNNHFNQQEYIKMGYKSSNFEFQMNYVTSTDQLKISAIVSAMAAYGNSFYNCLNDNQASSFDLKKAFGRLTNFSPEVTGRKWRIRLDKPIPRSPGKNRDDYNQFHAFVCHAVADDKRQDYRDCLVEVKRIDVCVHKKLNGSSDVTEPDTKSPKDFLKTIKSLDDSCKNADKGMAVLVGCKLKTKAMRGNVFPYVVDFFLGNLRKSPALGRLATEVGSIITRSREGSEALNEVVTLIEIYKQGAEKKARLMKAAKRDVHQRSIFSRISAVLSQYKQHISDATYKTVAHVHNVMTTVEKILVESASTLVGQDLSPNVHTLRSWSGFMDSVIVDWSHNRSQFPPRPIGIINSDKIKKESKLSRPNGLIKVPNEVGFMKSPHEEPLNKLIASMKRLGQPGTPRRSTALMSLANTFLLATMFYECISLLAGAIYRDDSGSMSSSISAEAEESDRWQSSRDRRSSPPIDEEDFQLEARKDEEEPLSAINETDKATATTVNPDYESVLDSVGNSSETEIPDKNQTNGTEPSDFRTEFLN